MFERYDLVRELKEYLALQKKLLSLVALKYPFGKTPDEFRALFPQRGYIKCDGKDWIFHKHGYGICFANEEGVIVDPHDKIHYPELVDAWRFWNFLESKYSLDEKEDHLALQDILKNRECLKVKLIDMTPYFSFKT